MARSGKGIVWVGFGAAVAAVALAGCGAGKAVRPDDPSYAAAVGETKRAAAVCHAVDAEGSPLVVDWKPEERADLEVAMRKGVAVVRYDCEALRLLPDCRADGDYGFVGVTRKEQVISLNDADEAKANLPLNGGSLGASLGRGSALDIALVMVGKNTASSLRVARSGLRGRCEGATHFVRAANVGAFAMKTRTSGEAAAAAAIFGLGGAASSSSAKSVDNKDGDVSACQRADVDAPKAPSGCAAPLRVQLLALDKAVDEKAPAAEVACPKGLTAAGGKCVAPAADAPRECRFEDLADCTKQCDAGSIASCLNLSLGATLKGLEEGSSKYDALTARANARGCELGDAFLCTSLAGLYESGIGVARDPAKARRLYAQSCDAGHGPGCRSLGDALAKADKARAAALYSRGCSAGDGGSCFNAGNAFEKGEGVAPDPARAASAFRRGCGLNDKRACARAKLGGKIA